MIIDAPRNTLELQKLWKHAFGDPEEFINSFFRVAYSPDRCRCVYKEGVLAAMLYWFDCSWAGKRIAYLYAVTTDWAFRGQGLCRRLMEDTHRHLHAQGYHGSILVPRTAELFSMYEKMGYSTCSGVREFSCAAGIPVTLRQIDAAEYALLRQQYLPLDAVVQEGETLALLETYASFYAGENALAAAYADEGKLTVCELLGSPDSTPGIVSALGHGEGKVRMPGKQKPFAMYRTLTDDASMPSYFGLALD